MAKESNAKMSNRQKTIIVAVIVVVLIIIWQVMSLFPKSPPPPSRVTKTMQTNGPGGANSNAPMSAAAPAVQQPAEQLRQAALPVDNQFAKTQKETEQKYVGKLNELEELRIQKQIAEVNQAIAAAKLATVTAEKDISDLLTKPAPPPPLPPSAYANQLITPTTGAHPIVVPAPPPVEVVVGYTVVSVSMQLHRWSAILGYQGRLFNVNVGDILPPDGSVVTSISKSGVMLKKDGQSRRISMISSI